MQYNELEKMPAEAFLNPELFRIEYDSLPENQGRKEEQYQEGLKIGREWMVISISCNNVWGACCQVIGGRGSVLSSYEGIGYHSCTADLLRGFLDSSAEIRIYRNDGFCTVIKNRQILRREE